MIFYRVFLRFLVFLSFSRGDGGWGLPWGSFFCGFVRFLFFGGAGHFFCGLEVVQKVKALLFLKKEFVLSGSKSHERNQWFNSDRSPKLFFLGIQKAACFLFMLPQYLSTSIVKGFAPQKAGRSQRYGARTTS